MRCNIKQENEFLNSLNRNQINHIIRRMKMPWDSQHLIKHTSIELKLEYLVHFKLT